MPNSADWEGLYAEVLRLTSLNLWHYDQRSLQPRILRTLNQFPFSELPELTVWLNSSESNRESFLDSIQIPVSEMFRDPERWEELENLVLPGLIERSSTLRIWCAGCSFGAEPFSLAMILDAKFPGDHQILATDVHTEALSRARQGTMSPGETVRVPNDYRIDYLRRDRLEWRVRPILHSYIKFERRDLLTPFDHQPFDLIACRNVAIYFTDAVRQNVYRRLASSLRPGGVLFLGATESVESPETLGLEQFAGAFYRRNSAKIESDSLRQTG